MITTPTATADILPIKGQGEEACPKGHFCLYDDVWFNLNQKGGSAIVATAMSISDLTVLSIGEYVSSFYNRTALTVYICKGFEYVGPCKEIKPNEGVDGGKHENREWNRTVRSVDIR
ncbi:peptidase inhibitor family I36 protein [Streptomyces sp. NPDC057654]|uniref:peptidase inhibitor family I36 protein n=1 Tax=Streptomyces sp. NPDC057654 TaxID=3346196 RepID=UPI0036B6C55D